MMKRSLTAIVTCSILACAAQAQVASFNIAGTSCATSEGTPTMGNIGLPVLGQTFDVTYTGPNRTGGVYDYRPYLVVATNLVPGGNPIPQTLFFAQPAGCNIYLSNVIVVPMPLSQTVRPAYDSSFTIGIPNDNTLQGLSFFVQWLNVYIQCGIRPGCPTGWVATSEAGIATMGVQPPGIQ